MCYRSVSLAVLGLLCALGPLELQGQHRADPIRSLEVGQLVKIRTLHRGVHIGRVRRLESDTVHLWPQDGSARVAMAAIDQLWVRGTATKKGALIGGTLGGVLGGLLLGYASYAVCDAAECAVDAGVALEGLAGGAAFGAITGAVFGAMMGQWHQEYP
jgi:hypothetical protein